jgi:hypothetical protein
MGFRGIILEQEIKATPLWQICQTGLRDDLFLGGTP